MNNPYNWHWHDYSKWSETIPDYHGVKRQYRVCSICNKVQHRSLKYDALASVILVNAAIKKLLNDKTHEVKIVKKDN